MWITMQSFMWIRHGKLFVNYAGNNPDGVAHSVAKVKQVQMQEDGAVVLQVRPEDKDSRHYLKVYKI